MNGEERGHWYLITGLVIGIALGIIYTWIIQPVEYIDTPPASLRQDFKDRYRALIASAYLANRDLVRAQARLELLRDEDPFRMLSEQAQRTVAENGSPDLARALGLLAVALSQASPDSSTSTFLARESAFAETSSPTGMFIYTPAMIPLETFTQAPTSTTQSEVPIIETESASQVLSSPVSPSPRSLGTPTKTLQLVLSNTPLASLLPNTTPGGPFSFLSQEELCELKLTAPLIQVEALDRFGTPIPGVLVIVSWREGEERFYTGLKPEKSLGYADFSLTPGLVYAIRLGEGGEVVSSISALQCKGTGGESYWGAWLLKFIQP